MRVLSVQQDSPLHAGCGGTQRFVREGQPRWCAEESKSIFLKQHMKIVLRKEGLCWKGGKLDRARGPMEECYIHHRMGGHGGERMVAGYPVDGFCLERTWCSSSTAAIGMAVQSLCERAKGPG